MSDEVYLNEKIINKVTKKIENVENVEKDNKVIKKKKREKKEIEKETKNITEEKTPKNRNISPIQSIKENYFSWICIFISVSILSYPNVLLGLITFFIALFLSYFAHYESHKTINISTIIHHYHHSHNNFLSHFTQILVELICLAVFVPFFYIFKDIFLDPWILIFFTFFYSSIHNINYGYFKVNDVHRLHHKCMGTNIGPDICDILFGTKNSTEICVENTDHYLYNIWISYIIVVLLQYLWGKDSNKKGMLLCMNIFVLLSILILIIFSIYLWFTYDVGCNKKYLI